MTPVGCRGKIYIYHIYRLSWDAYSFLWTTRSMSVKVLVWMVPLHGMGLITNVCCLVCNSWVCHYPYAARMIIGYVKIVTLRCNFMLLLIDCRTMIPCVLLMSWWYYYFSCGYPHLRYIPSHMIYNILWALGFPYCTFD